MNENLKTDVADTLLISDKIPDSVGTNEPRLKSNKGANFDIMANKEIGFFLKISDLTTTDNPFVFFNDLQIDNDGYLVLEERES